MLFFRFLDYARQRYAAHRRYQRAMAEIRSMSNDDLHEIGAFQMALIENARHERDAG